MDALEKPTLRSLLASDANENAAGRKNATLILNWASFYAPDAVAIWFAERMQWKLAMNNRARTGCRKLGLARCFITGMKTSAAPRSRLISPNLRQCFGRSTTAQPMQGGLMKSSSILTARVSGIVGVMRRQR